MEKKLEEYRRQKHREELIAKTKNTLAELPNKLCYGLGLRAVNRHPNNSNLDESYEPLLPNDNDDKHSDSDIAEEHRVLPDEEIDKINCCTTIMIMKFVLYFIIWATVYGIFIYWEFGAVYFIISGLVAIYFNTGTRRKQKGEVSAYSVFNKDCQSIQGTVKAEDLEKQMIYGRLF